MRTVFVDAWAWLALVYRKDEGHGAAVAQFARLRQQGIGLITTCAIICEVAETSRRRYGHFQSEAIVERILQSQAEGATTVVDAGELVADAFAIYRRFVDQPVSLTDCLSFAVMQRESISTAFTGDTHFTLLGFNIIPDIPR